jgi:glucokinase
MKVRELGQLERAIGGRGIEEEWQRVLQRNDAAGGGAVTKELLGLKATQIFDLAAEGDRTANDVIRYTSGILADALTDISQLLNPEVVVLGGGVGSHPELCRATEKLMQRNEFAQPMLRSSSLGTQAQLHGAVSISLSAVEQQILE